MFGIIKEKDNVKILTAYIEDKNNFLDFVKNDINEKDYTLLANINLENIKENKSFGSGKYLLQNENIIKLFEKKKIIQSGYIYNSKFSSIEIICIWEIIINKAKLINIKSEVCEPIEIVKSKKQIETNQVIKKFEIIGSGLESICIIGKRGTGKSTLITDILKNKSSDFINNSLIISAKENCEKFYKNKFPKTKILSDLDKNIIKNYLENGKQGAIVLDDCYISKKQIMKNEILKNLINNSKNYNKSLILTLQFAQEIGRNFDLIFLLNEETFMNQKKLYHDYGRMFSNLQSFKQTLEKYTNDYGSLVIINNSTSEKLEDKIMWYKTDLLKI